MEERVAITHEVTDKDTAIEIRNGTFAWDHIILPSKKRHHIPDNKLKQKDADAIYKKAGTYFKGCVN